MEEWRREDTDLAAFARKGPEVKTRGRLSTNPAELIHLQQKDATCGYGSGPVDGQNVPTIAPDLRTMSANHGRVSRSRSNARSRNARSEQRRVL